MATFDTIDFHKGKIECVKYSQVSEKDTANMMNAVLTASEDRTVKIWDRQSGKKACQVQYRNQPFYSVETN